MKENDVDEQFYARADAHINLSNEQLNIANRGRVSASMMYSVARFNAWVSACEYEDQEGMAKGKTEILEYFTNEYKTMLNEHLDDYIGNFDKYMKPVN